MHTNSQLSQLLSALKLLYPKVSFVIFYKIHLDDGKIIRNGYEDKNTWPFISALSNEILLAAKQNGFNRFAAEIREKVGRDPLDGEIRIAYRPVQGHFRSVFVDDVNELTRAHILIETSPNNWQAHFILDQEVTIDVAAVIQRYMIAHCTGTTRPTADPAAASPRQARRFPDGRFIHDALLPLVDVNDILKKIETSQQVCPTYAPKGHKSREEHWDDVALEQAYLRHISKIYDNPKAKDKSYSAVDISFAMYLMGYCQLDEEFVKEALRRVSQGIDARHANVDDYLDRTIRKALSYLSA